MKYLINLFILGCSFSASSQLTIGGTDPNNFVSTALSSANVTVSNVSYTGYDGAICYFSADVQNMPFRSGLLMTTGANYLAKGPNNEPSIYFVNNAPGYAPLSSITGGVSTYDAAVISFDAVPNGDTLRINYIFASEEYPEYVGSQFCDVFAIYISGPGISGIQNIAKLPGGVPILVNNVNNGNPGGTGSGIGPSPAVNPACFVSNGNGHEAPYNSSDTYLQYDGMTIPMTAKSAVTPNQTYHIVIAIADGGDGIFDSGAFIEEGGITASLGENDLSSQVSVFYNPGNQQATLEVKNMSENWHYSIVDLSGKVVKEANLSETLSLDLSSYPTGMYLITIGSSNGKITKKIIR